MVAQTSFWEMLTAIGREHDRQINGLLTLTRELRLELDKATRRDEIGGLCHENRELQKQMSTHDITLSPSVRGALPPGLPSTVQALPAPLPPAWKPQQDPTAKQELSSLPAVTNSRSSRDAQPVVTNSNSSTGSETLVMLATGPDPKPGGDEAAGSPVSFKHAANPKLPPEPMVAEQPELAPTDSPACNLHPAKTKKTGTQRTLTSSQSLEPPEATEGVAGWLNQHLWFVTAPWFQALAAILIMLNTVVMIMEAQYHGMQAGYNTGFPGVDVSINESLPWAELTFFISDRVFTTIFLFELVLQILRFRTRFFKVFMNWIDLLAVLGGVFEALMEDAPLDSTVLRLLRVSKPVRSIRFLKNKSVREAFNVLAKCLKASAVNLFWSLCLLMMIQCMIGMIVGAMAQDFINDLSNPEQGRHEVFRYFGTFSRCLVSMFEIHMANWASPCRVLINNVGELPGTMLVYYRCIMGFALMSVISATFVQQAMSVQQHDHEVMILRKERETENFNKKLKALFDTMDEDGNGHVCRGEFEALTDNKELKSWMQALEINPDDLQSLFDMLDDGDGNVSADEFLMGATRLRGNARSLDVARMMVSVNRVEHMMERKMEQMTILLTRLDGLEELFFKDRKCSEAPKESSPWMFGTTR